MTVTEGLIPLSRVVGNVSTLVHVAGPEGAVLLKAGADVRRQTSSCFQAGETIVLKNQKLWSRFAARATRKCQRGKVPAVRWGDRVNERMRRTTV